MRTVWPISARLVGIRTVGKKGRNKCDDRLERWGERLEEKRAVSEKWDGRPAINRMDDIVALMKIQCAGSAAVHILLNGNGPEWT